MSQPAAPTATESKCEKCGCPLVFAHNLDSGKDGPIDLRATVYFVRRNAEREGALLCMTAKKLMERLVSVTVEVDGQPVTYAKEEILGFFVSHFITCPSRDYFSGRNRK
jgi:hypothetical protein